MALQRDPHHHRWTRPAPVDQPFEPALWISPVDQPLRTRTTEDLSWVQNDRELAHLCRRSPDLLSLLLLLLEDDKYHSR